MRRGVTSGPLALAFALPMRRQRAVWAPGLVAMLEPPRTAVRRTLDFLAAITGGRAHDGVFRVTGGPLVPPGSRYVAMGSSFAAGPGIPGRAPGSPRRAGRSSGNYAHLVARALGLGLHDVTYSGATTSDVLSAAARGQPAQLAAVTPDTRLVTITAGGNDVGFLPRLTLASLPWPPGHDRARRS
jgi:lysophospholipase L1-like esterase